jgi:hypothetical protein
MPAASRGTGPQDARAARPCPDPGSREKLLRDAEPVDVRGVVPLIDRGGRVSEPGTPVLAEGDPPIAWLMEGDPAIRWQVQRDLLDEPPKVYEAERSRLSTQGWAARLLDCADENGRWTPRIYGQKWISTTYSAVLLWQLGLPRGEPRALRSCGLLLDEGLFSDGGIAVTVTRRESETCVTGMVLGVLSWFGVDDPRVGRLVGYLLAEQLPDGGWNCQRRAGASHSSFHTTINVLEGLREYASATGPSARAVEDAQRSGREFLLRHRLYRSHRTGAAVDPRMTRLSFPPRWRHDVLRGLDHFRAAQAAPDDRLSDAMGLLATKRRRDGTWPLQERHAGATWFEMERVGQPSRWNTLRALRVGRWWSQPQSSTARSAGALHAVVAVNPVAPAAAAANGRNPTG